MSSTWRHRAVAVAGLACVVAAGSTLPAQAGKDLVKRGEFDNLEPAAPHHLPALSGRAQLVRTGGGMTKLSVHLKGLAPGETYGVHLHNQPCDFAPMVDGRPTPNPGGAHYAHKPINTTDSDPTNDGRPPNELWASSDRHDPEAGVTANRAGNASGHGVASWIARPEARSVVVHTSHSPTTAGGVKIACADLR